MAHNKLYRNFIILQEDERSHGISEEKPLSGYAKIEAKSDKCKISFYAQNLNKDDKYTIVLICYKKDLKQIVDLGSLEVTDVGKGEACKEYYINNIAGLDFSYEKISGAAICKYKDGELSFLMYGFMNGENVKDGWKKCKLLKHADKDDKPFKIDIPKIENDFMKEKEQKKEVSPKEEYHGSTHKEDYYDKQSKSVDKTDKDEDKYKYYPKDEYKSMVEPDGKGLVEHHEEEHMHHHEKEEMDTCEDNHMKHNENKYMDEVEGEHMPHHEKSKMDDCEEHHDHHKEHHMDMDKHKEEHIEHHMEHHEEENMCHNEKEHEDKHEKDYIDCSNEEYGYKNKVNSKYKENHYDYYGDDEYGTSGEKYNQRVDSESKFDQYESIIENSKKSGKNFELSGEMGKFFSDIMNGFEEYEDKSQNIKHCKWYKIKVKNLDDMCNISNYNRYTVAYYPMLNYYPYIRKYGYFMIGYKCDPKGNLKYIVYGVPGNKDENEQPYAGKTGFVTWMNMGDRDEGCWLMFYDFRNSTIVVPMK